MLNYLSTKLHVRKPIIVLLFLAALFFVFQFVVLREYRYITQEKALKTELEERYENFQARINNFKLGYQELVAEEEKSEEMFSRYTRGLESQLVLLEISKISEEAGLELLRFQMGQEGEHNDFRSMSYRIVLRGDYESLIFWLRLVERVPYYVKIDELHISKYEVTTWEDNLRMQELQENFELQEPVVPDPETVFFLTFRNVGLERFLDWQEPEISRIRIYPFDEP